MKNWIGLDPHPTDKYLDWRDKKPLDKAAMLRVAYDKIAELGCLEELTILTEAAYGQGGLDESDQHAGESL